MVAVEFVKPGTDTPDPEFTKLVQTRALAKGLILLTCGVYSNVVRFLFPLTIEDAVMEEGLAILADAMQGK
jgi:4-aminobutyrate aminotransferase/4-aminobutyrate aminotransferase/(S)-3-amino-2-methylpropionate transaminase